MPQQRRDFRPASSAREGSFSEEPGSSPCAGAGGHDLPLSSNTSLSSSNVSSCGDRLGRPSLQIIPILQTEQDWLGRLICFVINVLSLQQDEAARLEVVAANDVYAFAFTPRIVTCRKAKNNSIAFGCPLLEAEHPLIFGKVRHAKMLGPGEEMQRGIIKAPSVRMDCHKPSRLTFVMVNSMVEISDIDPCPALANHEQPVVVRREIPLMFVGILVIVEIVEVTVSFSVSNSFIGKLVNVLVNGQKDCLIPMIANL